MITICEVYKYKNEYANG